MSYIHQVKGDVAHGLVAQHDPGQENNAADGMNQQVAIPHLKGLAAVSEPDEEN